MKKRKIYSKELKARVAFEALIASLGCSRPVSIAPLTPHTVNLGQYR